VVAEVIHSFRTMSDAKGMEMTEQEMRSNCWAPMLEKLADGAAMPVGPDFRDRALCFVAWAAFGDTVRNGDVVDIVVAQNRDTTVVRRPRKWWRAGRRRLGRLTVATERQT
jgi:hypothetical protein